MLYFSARSLIIETSKDNHPALTFVRNDGCFWTPRLLSVHITDILVDF